MNYQSCNGIVYTIKPGDTLYKISQRYGIPTAKILRANPYINIYNLQIGENICIPTGGNTNTDNRLYYTVGNDESIKSVLDRTNMTFTELLALNPLQTMILKPGLKIAVKKKARESEDL